MKICGQAQFTGVARANSEVEIVDSGGVVLATVTADASGQWSTEPIDLPAGDHTVYANAAGKASEAIEVTIEADAEESAEVAERAESLYVRIVEAASQGFDIDEHLVIDVLELSGKSLDEFRADIAELSCLCADEGFAKEYFKLARLRTIAGS